MANLYVIRFLYLLLAGLFSQLGRDQPQLKCQLSLNCHSTVIKMIGTSGCLEAATGTYHLSVTDADAMDTIDSEPAVTLDNILVPATNTTPIINPSLSPGATNLPTGTSSSSSK